MKKVSIAIVLLGLLIVVFFPKKFWLHTADKCIGFVKEQGVISINTGSGEYMSANPDRCFGIVIHSKDDAGVSGGGLVDPVEMPPLIYDLQQNSIQDAQTTYQSEHTQCHDSDKYFVVEQPVLDGPGSNLLVKYKNQPAQQFACVYTVQQDDFELRNPRGAEYFTAVTNHFLVINSGTGVNNRGITLYDLNSKQEVFHGQYSSGDPVITEAFISYWENTNEALTKDNCVHANNSQQVRENTIVSRVILDLATMAKRDSGEKRCVYQE